MHKVRILNSDDKTRHYVVTIGEGLLHEADNVVTDVKTFPIGTNLTDVYHGHFYVRTGDAGVVEDYTLIGGNPITPEEKEIPEEQDEEPITGKKKFPAAIFQGAKAEFISDLSVLITEHDRVTLRLNDKIELESNIRFDDDAVAGVIDGNVVGLSWDETAPTNRIVLYNHGNALMVWSLELSINGKQVTLL